MSARIDVLWGQSGTGKSEAIAAMMRAIYESDGLKSRVIIGDGSKATYKDRGLIDAGVTEVCDFSIRPWPTTTLARLCEGWWPEDVLDPESKLLPPTLAGLKALGVFAVEGLSVGAQYIMGDIKGGLAEQAGRGIKIGQDSPVRLEDAIRDDKTGKIIDGGGMQFGGNSVAHYGFVQRRMLANVERTKVFPNLVYWTAHEKATTDKVSGEKIVGPEVAGEAMTANIPRHFNNCLHFVTAARKKEKVKDKHTEASVTDLETEYRIYTRDHFHPEGTVFVKYKAVTRGVNAKEMPDYLTADEPGVSALEYYGILAKLARDRAAATKAAREAVA
jgi:hypothetical protein